MSASLEDAEKRRQHVYDLCLNKGQTVEAVAAVMKAPLETIRQDVKAAYRTAVDDILGLGRERIIVDAMRENTEQRARIKACLQAEETGDSARAKYEALIQQNSKDQLNYFKELEAAAVRQTAADRLEDHIAAMSFEQFNGLIGLPRHPYTNLPQKITEAQMQVFDAVDPVKRSWIHLNKSRQCGFTELVLRALAYYAFSKYQGKKIAIVAGTRVETTQEIFERLKAMFSTIADTVQLSAADTLKLKNGTSFHVVPASKHAINGWSKFGAFLLDESAFWNLEDDRVILNSFLPIARTNSSDVYAISNPNGPRGYFYWVAESPSPSWTKLVIPIEEGGKELYTPEQIQEMIESSDEDPASAYHCQFVGGRDSVFGDLAPEDITSLREAVAFD